MSEIAKCPCCGDGPDILVDLFDNHGKYPKGYSCCGAEFAELDQWNQYAAAMELAKAVAWERECLDTWEYGTALKMQALDEQVASMNAARAEVDRLLNDGADGEGEG